MLNDILNEAGVEQLSKKQQQSVNGGQKCVTVKKEEIFVVGATLSNGTINGGPSYYSHTCVTQCRPSFLGIGFGSWSEPVTAGCGQAQ